MKYDERKAFPHPVLCPYNEDYSPSENLFEAEVTYELSGAGSSVQIDVVLNLNQPSIKDCLVSGKAQYAIIVDSRDTYCRDVRVGSADKETFVYGHGKLGGSVEVSCFITAKEDIRDFSSPAFDGEFGNSAFQIRSGDVLALATPNRFHVGLEPFQEISSCWDFVEQSEVEVGGFEVALENERIEILVHPKQKQLLDYAERRLDGRSVIINAVILPALTEVLSAMSSPSDGYEDLKWYQVMTGQCIKHSIDIRPDMDCLKSSQKLLGLPLKLLDTTFLGET